MKPEQELWRNKESITELMFGKIKKKKIVKSKPLKDDWWKDED